MQVNYFLSLTVLCLIISYGESFLITVDAHAEECFYDRVTSGSKMNLMFEVAEGGFLDIDVKVEGPDGSEIYNGNRESSGKRSFAAHMDGLYKYCFSNKMSSMTPKVVMFTMNIPGRPTVAELDVKKDEASPSKLEDMVTELTTALTGVKHDQEYMQLREKVHRAINDNTNERVLIWAFFEAFIIISMTLGQVYYLRHFFEVRRVV